LSNTKSPYNDWEPTIPRGIRITIGVLFTLTQVTLLLTARSGWPKVLAIMGTLIGVVMAAYAWLDRK
jgi:hypothetical protein